MRVATWNIHGGVGADGRFDLARVVALLARAEPDIVALQEVDSRRAVPTHQHPFVVSARRARTARRRGALDRQSGRRLWPDTLEPLAARQHPHSRYLGRRATSRAAPSRRTLPHRLAACASSRLISASPSANAGGRARRWSPSRRIRADVVVMAGDFNDWVWRGSVQRAIRSVLPARTWIRTFPSRFPLIRLDRIHCRPHGALPEVDRHDRANDVRSSAGLRRNLAGRHGRAMTP